MSLSDGLREIEDERIALHYHISRKASSTKYYISVCMPDHDEDYQMWQLSLRKMQ